MAEPPLTILVADDEEILRTLVVRILERAGHRVISAGDGSEALERFREDPAAIDAVLLDVTMPPAGALAVVREMRAERDDLGVVLSSGAGLDGDAQSELEACGGEFVQKPFAPAALLEALERTRG